MSTQAKPSDKRFEITTRSGEVINLSKENVVRYLTNNNSITDSEFTMFFQLCKANKVNPFLKEAYIVKYGSDPATILLDYKVYQQIAEENENYKGMKHGVIVTDKDGNVVERQGEYKLRDETLIAGWCEVYRADHPAPTKVVASFDEFKNAKKDGTLNKNWAGKPCFMICKVAKAQALREAFPNLYGSNMYIPEEIPQDERPVEQESKTGKTNVRINLPDPNWEIEEPFVKMEEPDEEDTKFYDAPLTEDTPY